MKPQLDAYKPKCKPTPYSYNSSRSIQFHFSQFIITQENIKSYQP